MLTTEVGKVEEHAKEETNSRKILARARGAFGRGENPTFPDSKDIPKSEWVRVYTDGGLTSPDRKWWSLGGYGVWWPGEKGGEHFNSSFSETNFTNYEYREHGDGDVR